MALVVKNTFNQCVNSVIDYMAEKEGKKGDPQMKDHLMKEHGRNAVLLSHRILDEMISKEYDSHAAHGQHNKDFSKMYVKEIFLKGVFVCAMESVLFVNVVKNTHANEIMKVVNIKPFDFWRLMNSFLKFDAQMPRLMLNHFREIEIKIVTETAW